MSSVGTRIRIASVIGSLLVAASPARAQDPNVAIQWNRILQAQFGTAPSNAQRSLSMMHIAMFDAINAIEREYTPYHVRLRTPHGASPEAAGAQAARDVLVALYPGQQEVFDAALKAQLERIPQGPARLGVEVGQQVAHAVLAWRTNDGWQPIVPDPTYVLPPFPGAWQPTPPANSFATFTFYPRVRPFAMATSTQFVPFAPPTLTSERYARDLNETKRVGSATGADRSDDETLFAQLVAGVNTTVGFLHVWNLVSVDTALRQGLSLVDTARLFVLVNVALHDGLQTSFTAKFIYGAWRPVTAIRRADQDLNPATEADPTWTPLLATPPYPSYPGNVACLAAAAARALQLAHGRDDVAFSVTWPRTAGLPSVTRDYTSFWRLADDEARSRLHGGIHFQFESDASQVACAAVAEFTHANYMRPQR